MSFLGGGGASFQENKFAITDIDFWRASAVANITNNFLVKVSTDKYAVIFNDSGIESTAFTVDSDGLVDSIERETSLAGLTAGDVQHACNLTDDKIFIVFGGKCAIVDYSGVTPTEGTEQTIGAGLESVCVALTATSVILISDDGTFRVATVSGSAISIGGSFTVTSYVTDTDISRSRLHAYDATHVILSGGSDGTATTGFAIHFTFNTGAPSGTQDSKITLGTGAAVWADLAVLDSSNYVGVTKNMARAFSRSGTTLTAQDSEFTDVASTEFPAAIALSPTRIAVFDSLGTTLQSSISQMKEVNVNSGVLSSFRAMGADIKDNVSDNRMILTENGHIVLTGRRGNVANSHHMQIQVFQP